MNKNNIKAALFVGLCLMVITFSVYFYQVFLTPNLVLTQPRAYVYIEKGSTINDVVDSLKKYNYLNDIISFMFVSRLLGYNDKIIPGKYELDKEMNNLEAIILLKSGRRSKVSITFTNVRLKKDLTSIFCHRLWAKKNRFDSLLNDLSFVNTLGFDPITVASLFIPNTYFFYWLTSSEEVIERMKKEYDKFWSSNNREEKLKKLNMSKIEISILASIVQAETTKNDEKPRIAGVYINRLRKNMALQADPTVVFAWQDFSIKRLKGNYLSINSPYNTYKNKGLPPGPINIPSQNTIDAVLNYEEHGYIYFCAKEDFSGYHSFSRSYKAHKEKAFLYQRALTLRQQKE